MDRAIDFYESLGFEVCYGGRGEAFTSFQAGPCYINLATGTLTSVREFVTRAASVLGIEPERLRFGALPTRQEEMEHDPPRTDRMRGLVGWSPATSIEAGIRMTSSAARADQGGEDRGASQA